MPTRIRTSALATIAPLALLGVVACTSAPDTPGTTSTATITRTDSAGVEIVQHGTINPAALEQWEIGSVPITQIGVEERGPEHVFKMVTGVARQPDGRVIISADGFEMLAFDSSGAFLSRWARKGRGPGEFETLTALHRIRGDTILAYQYRPEMVSVFAPKGEYVRSSLLVRPSVQGAYSEFAAFEFVSVFPDGSLLVNRHGGERQIEVGQIVQDSIRLLRISASGEVLADFGTRWKQDQTRIPAVGSVLGRSVPQNLASAPHSPRRAVLGAVGDRMFYSGTAALEVELWSGSGALTRIVRAASPPIASTDDDDRFVTFMGVRYSGKDVTPPFSPAIGYGMGDALGNLWLSVHSKVFNDESTRFLVIDSTGAARAVVSWPAQRPGASEWRFIFNWIAIDDRTLTVTAMDEDDRTHVLVLPIIKTRAAPGL